ncbi:bifunctional folylpolyglutamate synthase/dihydrofolate synthase [Candidatus Woesearchaeota archaeon]|nr:bifunctional folylpolyglutamate synthase/dihydrofolate synthase [Candidatus Woesearchaeota archaeon]
MYSLEHFGIKLGLETITKLLHLLNNPQNKVKCIHIAGTNGKGSTTAYISQILQEAGYTVGMYTSPHLVKFNERIRVNGQEISDKDIIKSIKKIKVVCEQNNLQPSFFECTTALAFLYFAEKKVDFAVIEVGMGGKLDATNVINPLMSIITNISFDHQKNLGSTLKKIAVEKAGIIKENGLVLTGDKNINIIKIFKKNSEKKNAKFFILNHDYTTLKSSLKGVFFTFNNNQYSLKLLGEHQVTNACLAIQGILLLHKRGEIQVSLSQIQKGLLKTRWVGRLQILKKKPLIIIDGAHNVAGMTVVKKFVENIAHRKVLVLAIAKDKDIPEMIKLIVPLFEQVILTQGNYKPASLDTLEKWISPHRIPITKIKNPVKAVEKALSLVKKEDLILITGSLYLVGDVLTRFS